MLRPTVIFIAGLIVGFLLTNYFPDAVGIRERRGQQILAEFVKKGKIGNSRDYWLEQSGSVSTSFVALFFGYYDDEEECQDAANVLKVKNYNSAYRCIPAN